MKKKFKKLNIILTVLICSIFIVFFIVLVLRECRYSERRNYYNPRLLYREYENNKKDTSIKGTTPSAEQYEIVKSTFETLIDYYDITDKEMPNVQIVSNEDLINYSNSTSIVVKGLYDYDTCTLYLSESFTLEDQPVIAHELCHYLSDNGKDNRGFIYFHNDLVLGDAFNEGVTNYLSTKLFPFKSDSCVYEFETHVASIITECYGEEKFIDAYFSSDISKIRNDFDEKVSFIYSDRFYDGMKFTPFDIFVCSLQSYNVLLYQVDMGPNFVMVCMSQADSVEEMILNYSIESGKEENAQNLLKDLLKNAQSIDWPTYSNLDEMLK